MSENKQLDAIQDSIEKSGEKTDLIYKALFVSDGNKQKSLVSRIETLEYKVDALRTKERQDQDEAKRQRKQIQTKLWLVLILTALYISFSQLGIKLVGW